MRSVEMSLVMGMTEGRGENPWNMRACSGLKNVEWGVVAVFKGERDDGGR